MVRHLVAVGFVVGTLGCTRIPTVAVVTPQTGEDALYGAAVDRGAAFAVEQSAAFLPKDFEMVRVDSASDPLHGAEEVRRLVEDRGIQVVLGGVTSAEAEALLPVIEDERLVCLSPTATGTDLGRRSRYFYRLAPTDEAEGRTAARHLVNERGVQNVVVYTDGSRLTRSVEAEFRQYFEMVMGGTIIETVRLQSSDWRERSADTLHAYDVEAVYVVGHADRILEAMENIRANGFEGVRCTTSSVYLADVLGSAGAFVENVIFPLPVFDLGTGEGPVRAFAGEFEGRYGRQPDIFSAQGFDAMKVAIQTLLNAESLYPEEVRKAMNFGLKDFFGVTGAIAFGDNGDVRRYPVMHCIRDGVVRPCSTLADETRRKIDGYFRNMRETG